LPGHSLRITVHAVRLSAATEPLRLVVARDVSGSSGSAFLRDAFARILAHELRTPITSIYGGAQLLTETTVSGETRRAAAATVATEAERLYRTVEDLLILARFDEPLEFGDSPVLLQRFLPGLVHGEAERFEGIHFAVRMPNDLPPVRGRQGYVEQVVRHLLESASRFAPIGSTVRTSGAAANGHVEVRVVDHGPPISPDEAASMFDLFSRTPRATSDASGANLGMYVARRLVEAMGGTIRAVPLKRPTLLLTLPVFPVED
jgi:two-component system sensor histidine kinase KdpD